MKKTKIQKKEPSASPAPAKSLAGLGLTLGIVIGIALGIAIGNIGAGVIIGIALGIAMEAGSPGARSLNKKGRTVRMILSVGILLLLLIGLGIVYSSMA